MIARATVLLLLCVAGRAQPLAGTAPLDFEGELDVRLMDGAHAFVERQIAESRAGRARFWRRDFRSRAAYEASIEVNRRRFRKIIGATDERQPPAMERFGDDDHPALVAQGDAWRVFQVRWPVLEGVTGEGLLAEPKRAPAAYAVLLPDAGQLPEDLLATGTRLAAWGCTVVIPTMIDRTSRWAGNPAIAMTDQTHREWIYRQAFHMGRHIIGYEVQKVLAAVDWFRARSAAGKIGVAGWGEGGLIAFYAGAVDPRIDAVLVSGYFGPRERVWSEPIYRNVWGLLREFGDAEIATLIAPRALIVETAPAPELTGHKGDITTPALAEAQAEFERIGSLLAPGFGVNRLIHAAAPWSPPALEAFGGSLGLSGPAPAPTVLDRARAVDAAGRQRRQVKELENHVQGLVRASEHVRNRFFLYRVMPEFADTTWSRRLRHPTVSPDRFIEQARWYRNYLWEEVIGRFDEPLVEPNPRTRKIYDNPRWTGYDVVLDVWPEVIAWGVLLVPKDLREGERRPVVVCQHGRQGLPRDVIEGDHPAYHDFAARLADRGFVVLAPHNLYRGEDRYRWLDRKANSVKASLFSIILGQHQQLLRWLKGLPFVDPGRIGFYGLSYGGETAVRVPPILEDYALSVCSGDFNNWTRKVAATDQPFSFMFTIEWEMPYFDMGNTFDYAELAYLMAPRPFMVERGRHDRVGRDEWVAHEYAKVAWLYAQFGLEDRTEIEYFNGGHTINAEGTFRFLHRHLKWPERQAAGVARGVQAIRR
jgi:dienelactone hydrolase